MAFSKGLVALMFFVHASAMITLPFAAFFLTREYLLSYSEDKKDYSITVWSVVASVVTIFTIIISYIIVAFLDSDDESETIKVNQVEPSNPSDVQSHDKQE